MAAASTSGSAPSGSVFVTVVQRPSPPDTSAAFTVPSCTWPRAAAASGGSRTRTGVPVAAPACCSVCAKPDGAPTRPTSGGSLRFDTTDPTTVPATSSTSITAVEIRKTLLTSRVTRLAAGHQQHGGRVHCDTTSR
ncbi:hypothetical protein GCM10025868_32030 [Angustibacter aerolatus]|uniref:Uncharacterized protein n=1 Tax=Angustibacter aerolatus TaxID=1162965 RepID=A0ABQ6JI99_9ACTN|nr:hypothetical protein GCM10025868_32030 [Angustibacter aerolatus]